MCFNEENYSNTSSFTWNWTLFSSGFTSVWYLNRSTQDIHPGSLDHCEQLPLLWLQTFPTRFLELGPCVKIQGVRKQRAEVLGCLSDHHVLPDFWQIAQFLQPSQPMAWAKIPLNQKAGGIAMEIRSWKVFFVARRNRRYILGGGI